MDVFLQKMRIKKNRKVLVIEEAWKAIASPLMAEYIKFMYKTARKFWARVGVVTQEIQDIIGSEIVKEAIINNSDVVMLLDQSKFRERFDSIKAILGLPTWTARRRYSPSTAWRTRKGAVSSGGVHPPRNDQRRVRCGRTDEMLHDLHHGTGGERALKLYKNELRCIRKLSRRTAGIGTPVASESRCRSPKVNETGHVLNLRSVRESQ